MTSRMFVVITLATAAGGCAKKREVSCPSDDLKVEIRADDFYEPYISVDYDGDAVCISKKQADVEKNLGFRVDTIYGEYKYDDFGTPSDPTIRLDVSDGAGGASKWQDHGCAQVDMTWGIELADGDGPAIYEQGPGGKKLRIWAKNLGPCLYACTPGLICDDTKTGTTTPGSQGKWVIADYIIANPDLMRDLPGPISIFGERWLQTP